MDVDEDSDQNLDLTASANSVEFSGTRPRMYIEDSLQPENYCPIPILSCFGKLVSAVLNLRLNTLKFINAHEVLEENQTGFREGYSIPQGGGVLSFFLHT